jgi:hypothetical protein
MSQHHWRHRFGAVVVASALTTSLVVGGSTSAQAVSPSSPAGHGASWLADQLNKKGLIHNGQFDFDDYGLTIDTAFALQEIGGHKKKVAKVRRALSKHVDSYTTGVDFGADAVFAGAVAKLLVLAQNTGGGARHFGGVNLVKRLNKRVIGSGPSKGRIQDKVDLTNAGPDTANMFGQIFAARGLLRAHSDKAHSVVKFLLTQQCGKGFFRLDFNADPDAADQGCAKGDTPDTDVTALVVVELTSVTQGHPALKRALRDAVRWLKRHQKANGSFGGAGPTSASNANSTGVAAYAARVAGKCGVARDAAGWLAKLQVKGSLSGTPLAGERGAVAYDRATFKTAQQSGIDQTTRDQWRRSSAQAAPGLLALSRCG